MYGPAALVFYAYGRSWRGGQPPCVAGGRDGRPEGVARRCADGRHVRAQRAPKNRATVWLLDAPAVICSLWGGDHART